MAAIKNASSNTNSPAMNTNNSTKNNALATGLRLAITSSPHNSIAMLKNQNNMSCTFILAVAAAYDRRSPSLHDALRRVGRIRRRRAFEFPLPNGIRLHATQLQQLLLVKLQLLAFVARDREIALQENRLLGADFFAIAAINATQHVDDKILGFLFDVRI